MKIRHREKRHNLSGVEKAGHENAGSENARNCERGNLKMHKFSVMASNHITRS